MASLRMKLTLDNTTDIIHFAYFSESQFRTDFHCCTIKDKDITQTFSKLKYIAKIHQSRLTTRKLLTSVVDRNHSGDKGELQMSETA